MELQEFQEYRSSDNSSVSRSHTNEAIVRKCSRNRRTSSVSIRVCMNHLKGKYQFFWLLRSFEGLLPLSLWANHLLPKSPP